MKIAAITTFLALILNSCQLISPDKTAVVYPLHPTPTEEFAARELQRYVYLRTGILSELISSDSVPDGYEIIFIVGDRKNKLLESLPEDGFSIKTIRTKGGMQHIISGKGENGTLYGTYRLIEKMGVSFTLDGDVLPDKKFDLGTLEVNETASPRFAKRGLQPFHDFNVGPDWWNLHDYHSILAQMAKLRMNFLGFHTYPSWNLSAGPEANVWIGLPEDVDDEGNVKTGYKAGVVTTRRGWEVKPFPTGEYASGAGLLFENDEYGPDFLLDYLDWPDNVTDAAVMFNRYGDFQQKVYENAQSLGIGIAAGTELPLGIPDMLASELRSRQMDPEDPAVIQRLYEGMFLRLMRKTPVEYVWFWMPEIWLWSKPGCPGWEITTEENVRRDISLIREAAKKTGITSGFATSGWRLGTVDNSRWTDENTPKEWAMSSINTSGGADPVEKFYAENTGRPRWVIGWAEDDGTAGAHCCTVWDVQFWVARMLANSADAFRYGVDGMMAIHWRTSSITPNISALSEAGWRFLKPGIEPNTADPGVNTDAAAFWENWGKAMFGEEVGAAAGRILQKFDGCHPSLNNLVNKGYKTSDLEILDLFSPLSELKDISKEVHGSGNKARLDYWIDYLDASRLRLTTWVLSSRLDSIMHQTASLKDPEEQKRFAMGHALPARIGLARSWESMIDAYLRCAKSPGEVGTISSIESGNRIRILHRQDSLLAKYLGTPLPEEASVSTSYKGNSRIFVSSSATRWKSGEPMEIRPFVLSQEKCSEVSLFWRPLGKGRYNKVEATLQARNAYRVTVPESAGECAEYYLEAKLADGNILRYPENAPKMNLSVVFWK
jgi:hypothetical protein